ncbi:hypothetical protein [Psychroflexus planctonicus]|uniref:Uncharacterized protein n=1 Tax=Psychroflexus planctonicus TaxID=1526575 RepID=A0ABQ1SL86_9FLAO|nr:hypothetical protein [Psychroflexus planctonicus]GGE40971.1 hypothetical protein GCM10010832_21310 [Psychroflexus planctonicus]
MNYPINSYNYVSNFRKLLSCKLKHTYYNDNVLKNVVVKPDLETQELLDNFNILFRLTNDGFVLLSKVDNRFASKNYEGAIRLKFIFEVKNNYFINITDLPFSSNQKLCFFNEQDLSDEKLQLSNPVDENDSFSYDNNGINGEINLKINTKNQFFGNEEALENKQQLNFSILFNSREVKLRYNFYSLKENNVFKNYYLTDENNTIKIKDFKQRFLASGTKAHFVILEEKIVVSELYSNKMYLKKEDDILSYFSLFLPHPKPSNISYDRNIDYFINDIYVKI